MQKRFAVRPALVLALVIGIAGAPSARAQTPATFPEFEVASIKPNLSGLNLLHFQPSPGGRLLVENFPLRRLIQRAYGVEGFQISGGPVWIDFDRYDIEARAGGNPSEKQMTGPMLQGLLKDRFKLRLHTETKQLPVYDLTVARGGLKLQRSKDGSCTVFSMSTPLPPMLAPGEKSPAFCGFSGFGVEGLKRTLDVLGISMTELAATLSKGELRRTVIDKTGLAGVFDVHMKWAIDPSGGPGNAGQPGDPGAAAPSPDSPGPSIFAALQEQTGLKLESSKGPVQTLVIDHVEKPSSN
jgi:uncharacterized protein (TIGR03435 family)